MKSALFFIGLGLWLTVIEDESAASVSHIDHEEYGDLDIDPGIEFSWPVSDPQVNSGFGHRSDPFWGGSRFHKGLDLNGSRGDGVHATASGKVIEVGRNGGYGLAILVKHNNGYYSRYAHLSRTSVELGDSVEQGEMIGRIGSTGRSTGPHLHFEISKQGRAIDPLKVIQ